MCDGSSLPLQMLPELTTAVDAMPSVIFCILFISKPEPLSVSSAIIQVWHGYLPYRVLWGLLVPQSLLPLQLLITNMSCHYCLVRVMGSCYYYHFLATLAVCGFVWKRLYCFTRVQSFGNRSVLLFHH